MVDLHGVQVVGCCGGPECMTLRHVRVTDARFNTYPHVAQLGDESYAEFERALGAKDLTLIDHSLWRSGYRTIIGTYTTGTTTSRRIMSRYYPNSLVTFFVYLPFRIRLGAFGYI